MNKQTYTPDTYHPVQQNPPSDRKPILLRIILACLIGIVCAGVTCFLYLRYAPLPPNAIIDTSKVYSADGTILTDYVSGGSRVKVPLNKIPKSLQEATLAVEDAHFYDHGALNWRSIARAIWVNLKHGEVEQGGSTITQQLARNLYLTQARTWSRKIREAILSLQLEMHYSKNSILDQYLNVIYYGNGAKGVESAAEFYFGKPVESLDLAESAMIAGIPNGPAIYAPFTLDHGKRDFSNYSNAKLRQKTVLEAMFHQHLITLAQEQQAYQEPLNFSKAKQPESLAPYFTDYVKTTLQTNYGFSKDDLYRGGLNIHSTIDVALQKAAERAIANHIPAGSHLQVALVAMDPQNGDIKAMVGGTNYRQSAYNRVLAPREPGSSFKPVLYLTALQNGFTPATRINSEPTTFLYGTHDQTYEVHNFANIYQHHPIDMREAIARSDNVYAVATGLDTGLNKVIETAKALGIDTNLKSDPMKPYPSLALGVFPVSPLEMARAYSVLANGGELVQPRAFTEIDNAYGSQVIKQEVQKQQVEDPRYTFILTDLMKSVFEQDGTAARIASEITQPAAGKTGTTDTDAWMIGYTPDLVTVVWVGYDKNHLLSATESHLAAPIWADFMHAYEQTTTPKEFAIPTGVTRVQIDPQSGQLATNACPIKEWDYFLDNEAPKETCTLHPAQPQQNPSNHSKHNSWLDSLWNWVTGN
ncbi:PBP1A family penicillin-binding protein [Fodinisporobacter ferrooxydans]|uniref:PBP1A family penicillin-binding protein n=1 Tax=Fodinisporobacter ferrooxydans TaxID=2901836 RepID=A0ABY4CMA8_9BACL|nr:PBP1A family penicillin-binding protein [Alicyclobacillaceae bacterium MYW30-H2]